MLPHRCVFCLAGNGAEVRFDKKGRPYVSCRSCGARSFLPSIHAMRGVAVAPQLLDDALSRRANDGPYREWFDGQIAGLVQMVTSTIAPPAATARENMQRPLVEPFEREKVTA